MRGVLIGLAVFIGLNVIIGLGNAAIDAAPDWLMNILGPAMLIGVVYGAFKLILILIEEARRG